MHRTPPRRRLSARTVSANPPQLPVASEPKAEPCKTATNARAALKKGARSNSPASDPEGRPEIDWQGIAMFLAGVLVEEKPNYSPLILQVIADYTKP